MTTVLSRVRALLASPASTWSKIAAEDAGAAAICRNYVAVVAAVPAVSLFVGLIASARRVGTPGISGAAVAAAASYAMALAQVVVAALMVGALAPRFKSPRGFRQAFALIAYASTPVWLAGVSYVAVALSPLAVAGLVYAIYLLFLGVSPVMKTPIEQRVPYTLVCAIALIVSSAALRSILAVIRLPSYGL